MAARLSAAASVPFVIEQNNATGTVSYWRGGGQQSEADRNGISLADYIHAIYGFIRQAKARRVAMIGCGGGTLATMLDRAGIEVVLADNDPAVFALADAYFALPAHIERQTMDGAAYLARETRRFDVIVLDAYAGKTVPEHLLTDAFFRSVRARLSPGGIVLLNLIVASDADPLPHDIGSRLKCVFRQVRLLDRPEWTERNAILLAGRVRTLRRPHLLMKPERRARTLAASLKTFTFCPVLDRTP